MMMMMKKKQVVVVCCQQKSDNENKNHAKGDQSYLDMKVAIAKERIKNPWPKCEDSQNKAKWIEDGVHKSKTILK